MKSVTKSLPLIVILLLYFVIATELNAQSASDVLENIQKEINDHNQIAIKFEQAIIMKSTETERSFSGSLYLKGLDKYRIEFEDQKIISDGKTVWTYSERTGQVVIDKVKKNSGGRSPKDFLFEYPKEYDTRLLHEGAFEGEYLLELTPKKTRNFIRSIRLWVDDEDWLIRRLEYSDINDNVTRWEIIDINLDPKLGDSFFKFHPPAGANVIDFR